MRTTTLMCAALTGVAMALSGVGCAAEDSTEDQAEVTGVSEAELLGSHHASVTRGKLLFFNEFPGVRGNGRACADCHRPEDGFGLKPETVEARYQALQAKRAHFKWADDPLFRSIDADDGADDYTMLRTKALIRVTIDLPPNVRLADDPSATKVTVLRGVPTIFNVALTAPYQLDGRKPDLESQALGALQGHAEIRHEPLPLFLHDVANFQKAQFSSPGVKNLADAIANGTTPLPDPDPELTPLEAQGKAIFQAKCSNCHGGPSGVFTPIPVAQAQNLLVSAPRPPAIFGFAPNPLPTRTYLVTMADGTLAPCPSAGNQKVPCPSSDPGKVLISGKAEDFNVFDIPQVRGIRFTAPYFHDNSAATLEDVLKHYTALFHFTGDIIGIPGPRLPPEEYPALLAYLNKV